MEILEKRLKEEKEIILPRVFKKKLLGPFIQSCFSRL